MTPTSDPLLVQLRVSHKQRCRLAIQRVRGVWVEDQLRQENLKDVDKV